MAVTIKDVSAKCGLSISTVSKAFNNYADISLETRELVQRTAREIGYYPNAIARTLKIQPLLQLGRSVPRKARHGSDAQLLRLRAWMRSSRRGRSAGTTSPSSTTTSGGRA